MEYVQMSQKIEKELKLSAVTTINVVVNLLMEK